MKWWSKEKEKETKDEKRGTHNNKQIINVRMKDSGISSPKTLTVNTRTLTYTYVCSMYASKTYFSCPLFWLLSFEVIYSYGPYFYSAYTHRKPMAKMPTVKIQHEHEHEIPKLSPTFKIFIDVTIVLKKLSGKIYELAHTFWHFSKLYSNES